jgi:hypothetical protein
VTVNDAGTGLHYLELLELAERIRAREVSPMAVTLAQLERIASLNATLGSYALVMVDGRSLARSVCVASGFRSMLAYRVHNLRMRCSLSVQQLRSGGSFSILQSEEERRLKVWAAKRV